MGDSQSLLLAAGAGAAAAAASARENAGAAARASCTAWPCSAAELQAAPGRSAARLSDSAPAAEVTSPGYRASPPGLVWGAACSACWAAHCSASGLQACARLPSSSAAAARQTRRLQQRAWLGQAACPVSPSPQRRVACLSLQPARCERPAARPAGTARLPGPGGAAGRDSIGSHGSRSELDAEHRAGSASRLAGCPPPALHPVRSVFLWAARAAELQSSKTFGSS